MKKVIMVLGMVALLAVAEVSFGVANAKPGGQELRVVTVLNDLSPSSSTDLPQAGMATADSDVFSEGDVGGAVIGRLNTMVMATGDPGVQGAIVLFIFEISGEGQIHVTSGFGNSSAPEGRTGVIVGGTGIYRGVTGEFSLSRISSGTSLATFKFNSGRN